MKQKPLAIILSPTCKKDKTFLEDLLILQNNPFLRFRSLYGGAYTDTEKFNTSGSRFGIYADYSDNLSGFRVVSLSVKFLR